MDEIQTGDSGTTRAVPLEGSGSRTVDRRALRGAAMLIFGGVVVSLVAGLFHADAASANDHVASFTEYAQSDIWIGVHLGQFVGMALFASGMIALLGALNLPQGALALTARYGALSAAVSIELYGVLQAVDGVSLKHAVNAWASAAEPEKAMRFVSAEGIRWLEWGMRSYHSFLFGSALIISGMVILATRRVSRTIGILMGLSGVSYLAQGWIIGAEGFAAANAVPTLSGIILTVVWTVWLLISAWRLKDRATAKV